MFVAAVGAVAWAAGWLRFPHLPALGPSQTALDFSTDEVARNARYRAELGTWPLIQLLAPPGFAILIAVTPLRVKFVRWARRVTWLSVSAQCGLLVSAVLVCARMSSLPAAWAVETVDRRWGLSTQSSVAWLREQLVDIVLFAFVALVIVALVVAAIRRWPRSWALRVSWLAATAVLLLTLFPVLRVLPSEKTDPLPTSSVAQAMRQLTAQAGLEGTRLRVLTVSADSTQINAYASGSGPMAQVVVYDTLLRDVPTDQVLSVLAHELGHVRYRDSLVLSVASAASVGLVVLGLGLLWRRRTLGVNGLPFTVAQLPMLVALGMVAMLLLLPINNAASRQVEVRADLYALDLTQDPISFVKVMRKIALQGQSYLGDETPWGWARSHPTIAWRLALARTWARERGIDVPATSPDIRATGRD